MKELKVLILALCILSACNKDNNKSGSLTGSLTNIKDGTMLSIVDLDNDQVFQRVKVQGGKFQLKFKLSEPRLFGIWGDNPKYPKDILCIWLENSKISLDGNYYYLVNSQVKGSKSNRIFLKLDSINRKYDSEYTSLRTLKSQTLNTRILDSIADATIQVQNSYREAKIKFYSSEINSEVTLFYLSRQTIDFDIPYFAVAVVTKKDIESLYNMLPENFKNSNKGEIIKELHFITRNSHKRR